MTALSFVDNPSGLQVLRVLNLDFAGIVFSDLNAL